MFIPVRTDLTVYHRAWATFAIITTNVALFLLYDPFTHRELLLLEFGALKPWQWITGAFSHAGFVHLTLNMIYLFWFGQIVEGRIGTFRFLGLYLGMAAAEGCITQFMMLGAEEGGALGASGVIFGLMVIALTFTPNTKLTVLWWFYSLSRLIEVRIVTLAVMYLAVDLILALVFGFAMSSEVLHLIGALAGLLAVLLIRGFDWWYEPPDDEVAGDVREKPAVEPAAPVRKPTAQPPKHDDLPPLELD